ncbi:MAG: helix-turn-helix domain-containing protein [Waterburya sp.]
MIKWKLNEVMAEKRMQNRRLAELMGIHENSVYRLRAVDRMPRLSEETLYKLCINLKCTPNDLMEVLEGS